MIEGAGGGEVAIQKDDTNVYSYNLIRVLLKMVGFQNSMMAATLVLVVAPKCEAFKKVLLLLQWLKSCCSCRCT